MDGAEILDLGTNNFFFVLNVLIIHYTIKKLGGQDRCFTACAPVNVGLVGLVCEFKIKKKIRLKEKQAVGENRLYALEKFVIVNQS